MTRTLSLLHYMFHDTIIIIIYSLFLLYMHVFICTQYIKNCHFDLMFVTSQLKGSVVLNASMNVCY